MKRLLRLLVLLLPTQVLGQPTLTGLIYHRVDPTQAPSSMNTLPETLRQHLHALRRAGFTFVTASQATGIVLTGTRGQFVVVTFDDGFASSLNAVELLSEVNGVATWFITTGRLDTPKYMTRDELQRLALTPADFGAHSVTHFPYWDGRAGSISYEAQASELRESVAELSRVLKRPVYHYAWPYGEHTQELRAFAGSRGVVTTWGADRVTTFNVVQPDLLYMRRLNVSGKCSAEAVVKMARSGEFDACE